MFRRIELIETGKRWNGTRHDFKHGLCGISYHPDPNDYVFKAWAGIPLPKSSRHLNKNCRFFFTEAGWKKYGSETLDACKRVNYNFRIKTIKEKSVDVFYKDKYQVAVRPRKGIKNGNREII